MELGSCGGGAAKKKCSSSIYVLAESFMTFKRLNFSYHAISRTRGASSQKLFVSRIAHVDVIVR